MKIATIALHVATETPVNRPRTLRHAGYVREILAHAGLFYEEVPRSWIAESDQIRNPSTRSAGTRAIRNPTVLLLVGDAALTADEAGALERWIEAGGCLIGVGSHSGASELFGVSEDRGNVTTGWGVGAATLGEGYGRVVVADHPVTRGLQSSLHFFNGVAVRAEGAETLIAALDAHGRPTERAAVTERRHGAGRALLIALDLPGSVVLIQQGRSVDMDGMPAPDPGGGVSDGMLKADDGMVLDWSLDRDPFPGQPTPGFLHPVADELRALLIKSIFYAAQQSGQTLPVLWYYPRHLPALGHLSHDTDGHDAALGQRLLEVLTEIDVRGTWCVIMPGYPRELYEALKAAGQEIALHFDALEMGPLSEFSIANLRAQYAWLKAASGVAPVSNKNHYTRWEGRLQFFEWCEALSLRAEQSRGPSKLGCTGFLFGTAHPYFPVRDDGSRIDVLEVGFQSQDLVIFAPPPAGHALVDQCVAHHGIVHLIFHPAHIAKPGVADALRDLVSYGRTQGIEWWTCEAINRWERARRSVVLTPTAEGVQFTAAEPLPEATLLFLNAPEELRVNGVPVDARAEQRYGFAFRALLTDLGPERPADVTGLD
jgi:hypothetical protein